MIKNFLPIRLRDAAILTNAYVAATVVEKCNEYDQLCLYVDFTVGSLTNILVKVEFSIDNTNYFQESFSSISTTTDTLSLGVHKITATGKYIINVPVQGTYAKVSVIGEGTVTSSSCAISGVLTRL
jgi:hypothetical protein